MLDSSKYELSAIPYEAEETKSVLRKISEKAQALSRTASDSEIKFTYTQIKVLETLKKSLFIIFRQMLEEAAPDKKILMALIRSKEGVMESKPELRYMEPEQTIKEISINFSKRRDNQKDFEDKHNIRLLIPTKDYYYDTTIYNVDFDRDSSHVVCEHVNGFSRIQESNALISKIFETLIARAQEVIPEHIINKIIFKEGERKLHGEVINIEGHYKVNLLL